MKTNRNGFTVTELLIVLAVLALLAGMGIPSFQSVVSRLQVKHAAVGVVTGLNTARYSAVKMNHSVKFCIEDNQIILKEKKNSRWTMFQSTTVDEEVRLSINSSPVFSPTGSIAPLCTIHVKNDHYHYKITISIAGRIKVIEADP